MTPGRCGGWDLLRLLFNSWSLLSSGRVGKGQTIVLMYLATLLWGTAVTSEKINLLLQSKRWNLCCLLFSLISDKYDNDACVIKQLCFYFVWLGLRYTLWCWEKARPGSCTASLCGYLSCPQLRVLFHGDLCVPPLLVGQAQPDIWGG